jgi:predicted CXXCH cytochrome family protein
MHRTSARHAARQSDELPKKTAANEDIFLMKKISPILFIIIMLTLVGCARTWQFTPLESFRPADSVPPGSTCQTCHQGEYDSWKKTRHSSETHMAPVPIKELRECGACHDNIAAHAVDPAAKPGPSPARMTKTEQNILCGKCHYNQEILGSSAINPQDKHALFMSVGLEGKDKQIACLDCHSGHKGGSEMLVSIKAHICFTCHKEAIVTMGIFQPFNYLAFGKFCQACHAVHGGSSAAQNTRMAVGFCIICHVVGTALVD